MTAPTLPPRTWATDAVFTNGPRATLANKKIVSEAVAAEGFVAGLAFPVDQLNHLGNNHGSWLDTLRKAVLGLGVRNMKVATWRAGTDTFYATAVGLDSSSIPIVVSVGEADGTDSLVAYSYHPSGGTEAANVGNDDKLAVCYDGSAGTYKWIAAGTNSGTELVIGANDPTGTWAAVDTTANRECLAVTSDGAGLFVFVGRRTDAVEAWTAASSGGAALSHNVEASVERFRGVAYGGPAGSEVFVAVGEKSSDAEIWTSTNGTAWTQRSNPGTEGVHGVCWNGRKFATIGGTGQVLTSEDGITWTKESSPGIGTPVLPRIAADSNLGTIVAIGTAAQGLMLSFDNGASFTSAIADLGVTAAKFSGLDFSGGRFWLACDDGKIGYSLEISE